MSHWAVLWIDSDPTTNSAIVVCYIPMTQTTIDAKKVRCMISFECLRRVQVRSGCLPPPNASLCRGYDRHIYSYVKDMSKKTATESSTANLTVDVLRLQYNYNPSSTDRPVVQHEFMTAMWNAAQRASF